MAYIFNKLFEVLFSLILFYTVVWLSAIECAKILQRKILQQCAYLLEKRTLRLGLRFIVFLDEKLRIGHGVFAVAGKGDRDCVANPIRNLLHVVQVFCPRGEPTDATPLWFDVNVRFVVLTLAVDEHEPAPVEVPRVVRQVEQSRVVEGGVGFLVHVRMPVFVVDGFGRFVGETRKERRMGKVERVSVDFKLLADGLADLILYVFVGIDEFRGEDLLRLGILVDVDKLSVLREGTRMKVEDGSTTGTSSEAEALFCEVQQDVNLGAANDLIANESSAVRRNTARVFSDFLKVRLRTVQLLRPKLQRFPLGCETLFPRTECGKVHNYANPHNQHQPCPHPVVLRLRNLTMTTLGNLHFPGFPIAGTFLPLAYARFAHCPHNLEGRCPRILFRFFHTAAGLRRNRINR